MWVQHKRRISKLKYRVFYFNTYYSPKWTSQLWVRKNSEVYSKALQLGLNLTDSVDQQVASGVIPAESLLGPITHAPLNSQIVWLADAPVGVASGLTSGIPDPVTATALVNQG